jgi:hypothetical protein
MEGINSKIQSIKRRARGYSNPNHFKNTIHLSLSDIEVMRLYGTTGPPTPCKPH